MAAEQGRDVEGRGQSGESGQSPSVVDLIVTEGVGWGVVVPGGPYHAMVERIGYECQWTMRCNRRRHLTDLQLVSFDVEPEPERICNNGQCSRSFAALKRVLAAAPERVHSGGDDR